MLLVSLVPGYLSRWFEEFNYEIACKVISMLQFVVSVNYIQQVQKDQNFLHKTHAPLEFEKEKVSLRTAKIVKQQSIYTTTIIDFIQCLRLMLRFYL